MDTDEFIELLNAGSLKMPNKVCEVLFDELFVFGMELFSKNKSAGGI